MNIRLKKGLFYLIMLISSFAFSQGEANIWYFGQNAGLDFNSGSPVALTNGQLNTLEGCATISDSSGNLLFYTDGITVWDKNHAVMPNGAGLNGDPSSTQSATIVPQPGSSTVFYIFTLDAFAGPDGFCYSIVDISLNGGNGDVIVKNVTIYTPSNEKLSIIKHANNIDYWIVTHEWDSNNFISYLLTSSGLSISNPVVSSVGAMVTGSTDNCWGQMKISPDGSKLAIANSFINAELFDFDINTGLVSNPIEFYNQNNCYGIEFSVNSQVLYLTNLDGNQVNFKILQFDLSDPSVINGSMQIIYTSNTNSQVPTSLQLGPDNKIYVGQNSKNSLSVINNPDVLGFGCDFQLNSIDLAGKFCKYGLPPFVSSFFYNPTIQFQNACVGENVIFNLSNVNIVSASWNFGDGSTSNSLNPNHVYANPGTYTVSVTTSSSNGTGTATRDIVISEVPTATQPLNILVCDDNNDGFYSFDLTQNTNAILNGQDASQFNVRYFSGTNEITDPANYQNTIAYTVETITAEVYNVDNASCKVITTFDIQVFESPVPATTIQPITKCDNTSFGTDTDGRVIIDLTERQNAILNGQSTATFAVAYYTDNGLTNLIGTPNNYVNTNNLETIYVKVYNTQNPDCFATTFFQIEVFSLPVVNSPVILKQCDDNNDGFSAFNLTEAIGLISSDTTLNYTFYETLSLADSASNSITNMTAYTNQIVSNDVVYVRVENTNGCYRVVTLNLVVSTTLISSSIQQHFYVCDDTVSGSDTDGIATFDFSSINTVIQAQYPSGQLLTITYYRNLADALAEQYAIADISNYSNAGYPTTQNIYVRVDSQINNECLGLGHHVTLHVEPLPIVQPQYYSHCDDDQDGQFAFDTTSLESDLLNGLTNVTVSYFDTAGNPVTMTNPFTTTTQTLTARVINNTATACFYETTVTFTVDDLPQAFSVPNGLIKICDDETIPSLQDGLYAFDTSGFQSIILGSQTGMVVNYYDENGNALPSPLPNPFIASTQNVLVEVINSVNTNCIATNTLVFEVYPLPIIDLYGEELVCSNDPTFTKTINAGLIDETLQNNYSYNWYLDGGLITGENDYELAVNTEGIYTVDVISTDGCVVTRTIQVNASNIAAIQNIDIVELSDNNSIIIDVTGEGDYGYSLDNEYYQESNSFYTMEPGIYTVYVRDKNGCGVVTEDVSILGIPDFFTPNGDGYNDTWNIKGANTHFNAQTIIYIFDRYGKLIKQISPVGNGWDGTFNGSLMPSTDYWYSIELENGKIIKGHFSLKR
ncbi:T9SS type B sorting domain-containing protein [Flavobacterium sp. NRK F10]|uniref:T9SS type B sorting domain-containing protein n=1 Tax=Flavobacterium sp. NRK F10 TaxID=2954931 RepID=UPI002091CD56|nr:T9SS type B sorting domain-containing protein [Flavobacterium sp. NRK F10]MCO6175242.1 T9SS type B sorting domain-containing protein [Flavobacterium sp. NRK F10]